MAWPTVTLAGVSLSGAQQPKVIPTPKGKQPRKNFTTRESASEGPRRVPIPFRYHETHDDIKLEFTLNNDADYTTLNTSWEAKHQTVDLVVGSTTHTCLWVDFDPERIAITEYATEPYRRCKVHLQRLSST